MEEKGIRWKRDEPFFRDVLVNLGAVKVAWRNPTIHVTNDYTPEAAKDVFQVARTFMRHLSTQIHES